MKAANSSGCVRGGEVTGPWSGPQPGVREALDQPGCAPGMLGDRGRSVADEGRYEYVSEVERGFQLGGHVDLEGRSLGPDLSLRVGPEPLPPLVAEQHSVHALDIPGRPARCGDLPVVPLGAVRPPLDPREGWLPQPDGRKRTRPDGCGEHREIRPETVGNDDGRDRVPLQDRQQVLGMIDHRPGRRSMQRSAVATTVVQDNPAIGMIGKYTPKAGRTVRRSVDEHDCRIRHRAVVLGEEPGSLHPVIVAMPGVGLRSRSAPCWGATGQRDAGTHGVHGELAVR